MNVERDPIFGCLLFTGRLDKDGYGVTPSGRRAHLVAWERAHGAIAAGMEVDHACRRRRCCFEPHLELVTRSGNELSKSWKRRVKRAKCPRGHDLKLHAMVTPEGGRVCRACVRGEA